MTQSMADADELLDQAATAGTHQISAAATPSKSPVKEQFTPKKEISPKKQPEPNEQTHSIRHTDD
jgi:hypothetical protein